MILLQAQYKLQETKSRLIHRENTQNTTSLHWAEIQNSQNTNIVQTQILKAALHITALLRNSRLQHGQLPEESLWFLPQQKLVLPSCKSRENQAIVSGYTFPPHLLMGTSPVPDTSKRCYKHIILEKTLKRDKAQVYILLALPH